MARPNKNQIQNNQTYIFYYTKLKELAINNFEWLNLPATVDERFLELALFEFGYCLYFDDPIIGNLALTCTIGGPLDVYHIPIERRAYSANGYNLDRDKSNSVLIFNNYLHTPSLLFCQQYAERLAEIQRTIDVNVVAQKTPYIIKTDSKKLLTSKNIAQQVNDNQPVIILDQSANMADLQVLNLNVPFVADKLTDVLNTTWNRALTDIGIANSNQDKKERINTLEVSSNLGAVESRRNVMLNARKQACKQINAMFGTNIDVRFRQPLYYSEEGENEPIYSPDTDDNRESNTR